MKIKYLNMMAVRVATRYFPRCLAASGKWLKSSTSSKFIGSSACLLNREEKTSVADYVLWSKGGNNTKKSGFDFDDMLLEDANAQNVEKVFENGDSSEIISDYEQTDDDIRSQILSVSLEYVPLHGWSTQSIEMAIDTLELSPSSNGIFKRGGLDLVIFFIEKCNNALTEHLAEVAKKVNLNAEEARAEFREKAIKTRLKMIIPYIDTWPQAIKLMASPMAAQEIFENGTYLIDEIWYHSGDISTDMSWYTKRGALATIYVTTELYMLNDKSTDYKETWAFLHRRLQDAKVLDFAKDSLSNAASDTLALVSAGLTTAQNILGMNSKQR